MSDGNTAHVLAAIESLGTALHAQIVELRGDMVTRAELGALHAQIVELRGGMVTRGELGALHAQIVELRGDMVTRGELGALHAQIVELRGDMVTREELGALRADIVTLRSDIMARIDRLQDRLTTEQEGGIVTLGAAERAERIAKSTRSDLETLAEQIGALTRQVRVLSGRLDQLEDRH